MHPRRTLVVTWAIAAALVSASYGRRGLCQSVGAVPAQSKDEATTPSSGPVKPRPPGLYAEIRTNKGTIILQLEFELTPMTVANFVGLAEGTVENAAFAAGRPFFDGTAFHRVVPGHVIQAGEARGGKETGPGYRFPNEIQPVLSHSRAGMVGMANSGPHTNGSQFYITLGDRSYLDGNYTVFGHVASGMDVVTTIVQGDVIQAVTIVRVGPKAQAFKADTARFRAMVTDATARVEKADKARLEQEAAAIKQRWPDAATLRAGILFNVLTPGAGDTLTAGHTVRASYTGTTLLGGRAFASTSDVGRPGPGPAAAPFEYTIGQTRITPGLEAALSEMKPGERRVVIVRAPQGYGTSGFYAKETPGERRFVIPPNTSLVYEVEVIGIVR